MNHLLFVLLLFVPFVVSLVDIKGYLKEGYVVSLLPRVDSRLFVVDEKEKQVYVKAELVERPSKPNPNDYYMFIPVFEASVFPSAPASTFNTSCFSNYTVQLTSFSSTKATITISTKGKNGIFCVDSILVASRESIHFFDLALDGTVTAKFDWTDPNEALDIEENGFQVFLLPDGYLHSVVDIWETYQLFVGRKSFQDGIDFMREHMNITFVDRATPNFIPSESDIMDGDYLSIFGPSNVTNSQSIAVASLISLGTGGHTSHVAVCLHIDGVLYVVESCGKGIIRTEYNTWMQNIVGPEVMVSIMRLREDLQATFNASAAAEYFKTVEGLPYGNENFVFGWIDTVNGNYPAPMNYEEIPAFLVFADKLYPAAVNLGVAEGLNNRLGTTNLTIPEIIQLCDTKNISIVEVIAMPELESFVYPNPTGPRMVCDVFATKLYKAAGVFGDLEFQATELTPKDTYQLQIFSTTWERPQQCADDEVPGVCQFSGMYWLSMPGFNTIVPYDNMDETCSASPPDYVRAPTNC